MKFCANCFTPVTPSHMRLHGGPLQVDPQLAKAYQLDSVPLLEAVLPSEAAVLERGEAHSICDTCHGPLQPYEQNAFLLTPVSGTSTPGLEAWLRMLPRELGRMGHVVSGLTIDPSTGSEIPSMDLIHSSPIFTNAAIPLNVEGMGLCTIRAQASKTQEPMLFIDTPTLEAMANEAFASAWLQAVALRIGRSRRLLLVLADTPPLQSISPEALYISEHEALGRWDRTYGAALKEAALQEIGSVYMGAKSVLSRIRREIHPSADLTLINTDRHTRLLDPIYWLGMGPALR